MEHANQEIVTSGRHDGEVSCTIVRTQDSCIGWDEPERVDTFTEDRSLFIADI